MRRKYYYGTLKTNDYSVL